MVISKGTRFDRDQNSAFEETGFGSQLVYDKVRRLFVGGLALDVCVLASVMDALHSGLDVRLIRSAIRSADEERGRRALEKMVKAGAAVID